VKVSVGWDGLRDKEKEDEHSQMEMEKNFIKLYLLTYI
jgi:hypothetical protein